MTLSKPDGDETVEVPVWDLVVRGGHWTLVSAVALTFLFDAERMNLHAGLGYLIAAIVSLRVVWGFVGTTHARFRDFVFGPLKTLKYLRDLTTGRAPKYLGHSPAGGVMTLALLGCLTLVCVTGMAQLAMERGEGPLAAVLSQDVEALNGAVGDLHTTASNVLLLLIATHLMGVLLGGAMHMDNLIGAMVTGSKTRRRGEVSPSEIENRPRKRR